MNKNCKDYEDELALLHYGELGANEADRVIAHMASCPSCAAEYRLLGQALSSATSSPPSQRDIFRAADKVMEGIAPRRRSLGRRLAPALMGVGALALVVLYTLYFNPPAPPASQPAGPRLVAQADLDVVENLDLMDDMDTIEDMDIAEGMQEEI